MGELSPGHLGQIVCFNSWAFTTTKLSQQAQRSRSPPCIAVIRPFSSNQPTSCFCSQCIEPRAAISALEARADAWRNSSPFLFPSAFGKSRRALNFSVSSWKSLHAVCTGTQAFFSAHSTRSSGTIFISPSSDDPTSYLHRRVVEEVPAGIHINFLRAERSLHRWHRDDIDRIYFAEHAATWQGGAGGVQMHVLADAGHWVHTDNPEGLFRILAPSFGPTQSRQHVLQEQR